ncbi:hypothetical protein HK105_204824 [Polyrhizophydium stewartii]|uniref:Ankyrin repeat protein n=1 Tax=Polyrhizophydium stewartii TaxID=2732419 RepID=A0ABR4N803_9FUNG|nr:hypothetical protein HK105_005587 [Polyrhizophydium stewartii]
MDAAAAAASTAADGCSQQRAAAEVRAPPPAARRDSDKERRDTDNTDNTIARGSSNNNRHAASAGAQHGEQADSAAPSQPKRFRPNATNEWDRMPAEIQGTILKFAGLFTKFTTGRILAAELAELPMEQREEIWQGASDCNWRGDLGLLPGVDITSPTLRMSRSFFGRVWRMYPGCDNLRVAARNGWVDMFQHFKPDAWAAAAAREGRLDLLRRMIEVDKSVKAVIGYAAQAAKGDHFDIILYLHEHLRDQEWSGYVSCAAAQNGNIDVLIWLKEHRPDSFSDFSFNYAVWGNQPQVVPWLVDNTPHRPNRDVIESAAANNRLEILEYLWANFRSLFNGARLGEASDMEVLKWLEEHGVFSDRLVVKQIAKKGDVDTLKWALSHFELRLEERDLKEVYSYHQFELLKWAYESGVPFGRQSAEWAAKWSSTRVMNWAMQRDGGVKAMLVEATARHGRPSLVEWWLVRHGVVFGPRELNQARNNGAMFRHLIKAGVQLKPEADTTTSA